MYERHDQPLLSRREFLFRLLRHAGFTFGIVLVSLFMGMLGYHQLEGLSWLDSFLNAAMILGGMGPVAQLTTNGGKIFAGLYALYSGMVLLVAIGVLLLPVLHRLLHSFHLDEDDDNEQVSKQ
jgi:sensor histidine kinase YesM